MSCSSRRRNAISQSCRLYFESEWRHAVVTINRKSYSFDKYELNGEKEDRILKLKFANIDFNGYQMGKATNMTETLKQLSIPMVQEYEAMFVVFLPVKDSNQPIVFLVDDEDESQDLLDSIRCRRVNLDMAD